MQKIVHFTVCGENLTNLIRSTFVEGRLTVARNICRDSGAPEHTWLKICTGEYSICGDTAVGDGTLSLGKSDPPVTSHNDIPIDLETSVKRFEKQFAKYQLLFVNAETRIRYFALRCDYEGIFYKTRKSRVYDNGSQPNHMDRDKETVERVGRELAEMEPLFSWIYPLIGKKFEDYNFEDYLEDGEEIFSPDLEHPMYLPNMKANNQDNKKIETVDGKIIEKFAFNREDCAPNTLPDAGKYLKERDAAKIPVNHVKESIPIDAKNGPVVNEGRTQEWIDWIANGGIVYGNDENVILPIPVDIGNESVIIDNKRKMFGFRGTSNEITLKITSWKGTSIGAIHYYGHLEGPWFSWRTSKDANCSTNIFGSEPDWARRINITLTHPIEQWELDDYKDRFQGWNLGDNSYAFWNTKDIVEKAHKVFDRIFKPEGWVLKIDEEDLK